MKSSIYYLLLFFLCACQHEFRSSEELAHHIADPDNGYKYSKSISGVNYILEYRPSDMFVAQEVGPTYNESAIKRSREKFSKYIYFRLSILKSDSELLAGVAGNRAEFSALNQTLSFGMDKNIILRTKDRDTLELVDYIYPRMYGMSTDTSLLLVYSKDSTILEQKELHLEVKEFGLGTGDVEFLIPTDIIKQEPHIEF
jgi:hypothetical protein